MLLLKELRFEAQGEPLVAQGKECRDFRTRDEVERLGGAGG